MDDKKKNVILICGISFLLLEIWKQVYLYFIVFDQHYDVWYFPFQLCSMPIYVPVIYGLMGKQQRIRNSLLYFMQDYFLLGGVMALIVRDGFTFPEYPLLTLHGILWHIGMIALSVYIFLSSDSTKSFIGGTIVYLVTAVMALTINILLHPYGDADMYYISPYHASTQPVFHDLDLLIGRIPGIIVYIAATVFGGFLAHLLYKIPIYNNNKK